jgi:hypothetical protein
MHSLTMLAAAFLMSPDVYNRYLVRAYEAFDRTPLFVQLAPGNRGELASGRTRPAESRLGPFNQVKSDDENKNMLVGGRNVTSVIPKRTGHPWQASKVIRHNDERRNASGESSVGTTSSSLSPSGRGSGGAAPEPQAGNKTDPRVVRESRDRASVVMSGEPSPSVQARELLLEQQAILIRHGSRTQPPSPRSQSKKPVPRRIVPRTSYEQAAERLTGQAANQASQLREADIGRVVGFRLPSPSEGISYYGFGTFVPGSHEDSRVPTSLIIGRPNVPIVRDRELSIEERWLYGQWEVPGLSRDPWGRDGINRYSILGTDSQRLLWETDSQRLRDLHLELSRMSRTGLGREPQRYLDLISSHLELSRESRTRSMPGRIVRGR